jgi:hypothetical protein
VWKQEKAEAKKDYSLLVLIEGSLFLKGYHFRQFVDEYLSALGLKKENYHIDHFKNIGIYGAAKLAKKQD